MHWGAMKLCYYMGYMLKSTDRQEFLVTRNSLRVIFAFHLLDSIEQHYRLGRGKMCQLTMDVCARIAASE